MQPLSGSPITFTFVLLLALALEGRPAQSLLVLASAREGSTVQRQPELVEIPAGTGKECLSEVGAYYGSDFPPTLHSNASSAEECCRKCQASPQCTVWNWCGAAEGCLFPGNLRDADGTIGVSFRACDFKARPITVSGTTPLPPETARTGDMAAWTSGIPVSTKLMKAAAGYDLYKGVQMPYGAGSADFACTNSATSKNICELAGDVTAAQQLCDANDKCKGFQFCFRTTSQTTSSAGRIRLKGNTPGPLNLTNTLFNPYCSMYVSEDPDRTAANGSADQASVPTAARRALMQTGAAAGGASAPQRQPSVVEGSFNPLVGQAAVNATGAPLAAPAGGSAVRRSGRPMSPPAPELPRPAVPAEAPVSSNELDALLGTSGSNATVVVTAVPGTARAPAQNTPKGFDMYTPDYMGASGASQVTKNSENYASGQSVSNPSVRAGVGSNPLDDVITPADGVSDIGASRTFPSSAGDGYNRTIKGAAVLAPLGTKAPMDIFPGATFRYRSCAAAGPAAFLRADLMAVPSTQRANASAYAIHAWARVPFQNNATCNRTCVYKVVDNAYFNLEDSYIARARPAYVTTSEDLVKVPVADLDRAANGSVLAAPLVYIPPNEVANSTTERGLRFHMLRSNSTAYINELVRLYYYTAQIALGSKACSAGFPGLKTVLDYIQATLQEQVAMVSGQDYGSFASISGVPLGFEFITSQDVTTGARRSYGQSCLSEPNVLYDGAVLVAGADNIMASAEDCCSACWALGGRPGPARYGPNATINGTAGAAGGGSDGASAAARGSGYVSSGPGAPAGAPTGPTCNAWSYCSSPIGCRLGSNPTLYPQGFCELKYSGDVARHRPVENARAASGFLSGRTTGVLPKDVPNLFGIGAI